MTIPHYGKREPGALTAASRGPSRPYAMVYAQARGSRGGPVLGHT